MRILFALEKSVAVAVSPFSVTSMLQEKEEKVSGQIF
jgi:hypothetical protein